VLLRRGDVEIWAALLNAARWSSTAAALELDAIAGLVERHRITTLMLTTSVFHLAAEHRLDCFRQG